MNGDDITAHYEQATRGNGQAFSIVFGNFYRQLCLYVRPLLGVEDRRHGYEEDLASEVLEKIYARASAAKYRAPNNRDEIWNLIRRIARRAAQDRRRYYHRKKRYAERLSIHAFEYVAVATNCDIGPEFEDQWQEFLIRLPTDELRQILYLLLDQISHLEIAQRLGITQRSVDRKIRLMSQLWDEMAFSNKNGVSRENHV